MEREQIVRLFLEKGHLLTPKAVEFLSDKDINDFLDDSYTKFVLDEGSFFMKDKITIIKNLTQTKKEITTQDFVNFYKNKYEKMKNIITTRVQKDFISINKLSTRRDEVHVMGIVKEIKPKDDKVVVELEDMTGTASVIFDKNETQGLEADDVVAVRAVSAGSVLFGKKLIYPDIPLRQPAKGSGKACFISDLHLDEAPINDFVMFLEWFEKQDIKYLFVAGDIGDTNAFEKHINETCYGKKIFVVPGNVDSDDYPQPAQQYKSKFIVPLSNPAMLDMNGVKVLLIHKMDIDMLKKRYLGHSKAIIPGDYLVLDEVPDIVHCGHTHEAQITNYKSVTIVNSGSLLSNFRPVVIDFSTREANYIDLSKSM
jgi:DNA polymerase II small subunit